MLTLLVAAALQVAASPYGRCMAAVDHQALGNSQMLACATADMDRADRALNLSYRAILRQLQPARRATLRTQERGWIALRRTRCQAAARTGFPTPEIARMRCLVRETDRRSAAIARLR